MNSQRLGRDFYSKDVLEVAPGLLGKILVVKNPDGTTMRCRITETEAYRGADDLACHASKGRTARTEIMFHEGGLLYMYLIYGMYWMLNVVTNIKDIPQAVLIRGAGSLDGPGKLTKSLGLGRSFYGEDLSVSDRIWIEDEGVTPVINTSERIGIDYAGPYWSSRPWRFFI